MMIKRLITFMMMAAMPAAAQVVEIGATDIDTVGRNSNYNELRNAYNSNFLTIAAGGIGGGGSGIHGTGTISKFAYFIGDSTLSSWDFLTLSDPNLSLAGQFTATNGLKAGAASASTGTIVLYHATNAWQTYIAPQAQTADRTFYIPTTATSNSYFAMQDWVNGRAFGRLTDTSTVAFGTGKMPIGRADGTWGYIDSSNVGGGGSSGNAVSIASLPVRQYFQPFYGLYVNAAGDSIIPEYSPPMTATNGQYTYMDGDTLRGRDTALVVERALGWALCGTNDTLTSGTSVEIDRAPFAFLVTAVKLNLRSASSSGDVTVIVRINGFSIFSSNWITIDQDTTTSEGSASPYTLNATYTSVADDDQITFDVVSAGTNAIGLKIWIRYIRL